MQTYFPIIFTKLTKAIISYSKSEAALQIVSANAKTCKMLVSHASPPADNTLQKVLQQKSPIVAAGMVRIPEDTSTCHYRGHVLPWTSSKPNSINVITSLITCIYIYR